MPAPPTSSEAHFLIENWRRHQSLRGRLAAPLLRRQRLLRYPNKESTNQFALFTDEWSVVGVIGFTKHSRWPDVGVFFDQGFVSRAIMVSDIPALSFPLVSGSLDAISGSPISATVAEREQAQSYLVDGRCIALTRSYSTSAESGCGNRIRAQLANHEAKKI